MTHFGCRAVTCARICLADALIRISVACDNFTVPQVFSSPRSLQPGQSQIDPSGYIVILSFGDEGQIQPPGSSCDVGLASYARWTWRPAPPVPDRLMDGQSQRSCALRSLVAQS